MTAQQEQLIIKELSAPPNLPNAVLKAADAEKYIVARVNQVLEKCIAYDIHPWRVLIQTSISQWYENIAYNEDGAFKKMLRMDRATLASGKYTQMPQNQFTICPWYVPDQTSQGNPKTNSFVVYGYYYELPLTRNEFETAWVLQNNDSLEYHQALEIARRV